MYKTAMGILLHYLRDQWQIVQGWRNKFTHNIIQNTILQFTFGF